jgi:chitinase
MRAAFGTKYGISLALAPDIWYLRRMFLSVQAPSIGETVTEWLTGEKTDFDAAAMQQYVDWFGFMAYDLHGVCELPASNKDPHCRR